MGFNQVNYDLEAIRQHAEWITKQQVERLRDEDLIFAIEWFDYETHQKRRGTYPGSKTARRTCTDCAATSRHVARKLFLLQSAKNYRR